MNEEREEIIRQIKNKPIEEIGKVKIKKNKWEYIKGLIKDCLLGPFRFFGGFLGVTEENLQFYNGTNKSEDEQPSNISKERIFKDSVSCDWSQKYIERIQEEANIKSVGYTKDDLILTSEEYMRRKQEDAYIDSLPGYRRKDSERGDER